MAKNRLLFIKKWLIIILKKEFGLLMTTIWSNRRNWRSWNDVSNVWRRSKPPGRPTKCCAKSCANTRTRWRVLRAKSHAKMPFWRNVSTSSASTVCGLATRLASESVPSVTLLSEPMTITDCICLNWLCAAVWFEFIVKVSIPSMNPSSVYAVSTV